MRINALNLLIARVVATFFALSLTSVAYGQTSIYSDQWFDDSRAEEGIGNVAGCGVTEGSYDDDEMYYVETNITSPNGRGMWATFGYTSPAVRADVYLPWDSNDFGEFQVNTTHWEYCPLVNGDLTPYVIAQTLFVNTYENGIAQNLDYEDTGLLTPNTCGYKLCPYEDEKFCGQNSLRRTTTYPNQSGLGHGPCYYYVRKSYLIVTEPITGYQFCLFVFKTGTDNLVGNSCGI